MADLLQLPAIFYKKRRLCTKYKHYYHLPHFNKPGL
jgi:hypothetical protein